MIKTADEFQRIFEEIKLDPQNQEYTEKGIEPLYYANPKAKILIVGQAPGQKAQDTHMVWNDLSGDRLRTWLDVSRDEFYNSDFPHIWAAFATCHRTAAEGGGKRGNRIRRADTRTCFAALQRGRHSRRPSYPVTRRSWTNPPSAPAQTRCNGRT